MNIATLRGLAAIAIIAVSAVSAHAVPIVTTTFTQNEWDISLMVDLIDGPTEVLPRNLFINGLFMTGTVSAGPRTLGFTSNPFPFPLPTNLQFGVNTVAYVVGGVFSNGTVTGGDVYFGPNFTLVQPTTPRPSGVPDSGSTFVLMTCAAAFLCTIHRRREMPAPRPAGRA